MLDQTGRPGAPYLMPVAVIIAGFLAFAALSVLFTLWAVHQAENQYVTVQRNAQRQGLLVEQKICSTMHSLAALQPPAGSASANPSRAYEQHLHATLDQLGPDLGCR
jgi:hypothetical protein